MAAVLRTRLRRQDAARWHGTRGAIMSCRSAPCFTRWRWASRGWVRLPDRGRREPKRRPGRHI